MNLLKTIYLKAKSFFQQVLVFLNEKEYLKNILVFIFFVSIFSIIYFSLPTVSTGDDHWFHFRFAEEIRENGLLESFKNFDAIYFSKHAQGHEYFIYYNFLFYLVLVPFTLIDPLFLAIKLYSVFAGALAFALLYWCLKKFMIKRPFLWTIISIASVHVSVIYRFFLSRPYTLAPILLLLLLLALHKRKYFFVFLISFTYLFWHSSTFYFPLGIAICYFVFEKFYGEKGDYKNLLWTLFGLVTSVGLVYLIPSDFGLFIHDTVFNIYKETILGNKVEIPEGAELYKKDMLDFLGANTLIFGLLLISVFMFIYKYIDSKKSGGVSINDFNEEQKKEIVLRGVLFILSIGFFMGTVTVSARFQDFFVFFAPVFIALTFSEILSAIKVENKLIKKSFVSGIILAVFYFFTANMLFLHENFSGGASDLTFKDVGSWLNKNIEEGEVVFYPTWNWFPQLYYQSPKFKYVIGLEPRFLYEFDQKLYFEWSSISNYGFVCEVEKCEEIIDYLKSIQNNEEKKKIWWQEEGAKIAEVIKRDFQSHIILTAKGFDNLNKVLENSVNFKEVYKDSKDFKIFEIK